MVSHLRSHCGINDNNNCTSKERAGGDEEELLSFCLQKYTYVVVLFIT